MRKLIFWWGRGVLLWGVILLGVGESRSFEEKFKIA